METIDLKDLVKGILVVAGIAAALGKGRALQQYAAREAAVALKPGLSRPFFPRGYSVGSKTLDREKTHPKNARRAKSAPLSSVRSYPLNQEVFYEYRHHFQPTVRTSSRDLLPRFHGRPGERA